MESQEQQGSTCLKPVCNPHNQMHVDVKTSSICGPHLNEIDSSGEEHAPRVRKPYTITKQRERWTEEEHKKFLEALQLYGRAWRRIEEHIGTKTAVQIRSHAQKFFSKVVRESGSNDSTGTWKAVEIPPPRPKRKPVHPYPRKLGNLSNKGTLALKQLERPPLKIPAICEQENRSPTSVLSAVGSETLDSTFAHGQLDCSSPVASVAGSNDHDDGGQSPTMTAQEVNKLPCSDPAFPRVIMQEQPQMEIDQYPGVHTSSEAPLPTLKLFGKMVVVTDSNKSSIPAPSARDGAQPNFVSSVDNRRHQENNAFDSHSRSERLQSATHGIDLSRSEWNGYPGVMPPFIYCFTLVGDNSGESTFLSPPCWTMYGNLPFPLVHPQPQYPLQFPPEATSDQDIQREGSWTGSNTASISGAGPSDQNADGVDSKKVENLAEDGPMPCSGVKSSHIPASTSGIVGSGRGFVPYKRCAVESEVQHPVAASDDGENQALRLCL